MNVVCNRCSAEYEFDDALVSRRGTTVKCTNCGHQFRVRLPDGAGLALQDRWLVRKSDNRQFTFTNLRELQHAIESGELDEGDTFSRDGRTFRRLGDVEELGAFFDRKTRPISEAPLTPPLVVGQGERGGQAMPLSSPERITLAPGPRSTRAERTVSVDPSYAAMRRQSSRPVNPSPAFVGRQLGPEELDRVTPDMTPPPARAFASDPAQVARRGRRCGAGPGQAEAAPPLGVLPQPAPVRGGHGAAAPIPGAFQAATPPPQPFADDVPENYGADEYLSEGDRMSSYGALSGRPVAPSMPPPKSLGLRWIVGLLLIGALGLVASTLGRKYLAQFASGTEQPATDARLDAFLKAGQDHLRAGDLEAARAQFDRASGVNDTHPLVLEAQLDLAVARAEQEWLRTRLLGEDSGVLRVRAQAELKRRLAALEQSRSAAETGEVNKKTLGLARIDELRMGDKLKEARGVLTSLELQPDEPAVSYSLAALDLVEPTPDFELVTKRLRLAANEPTRAARAQPALVFALGRAGDLTAARAALAALGQHGAQVLALDLKQWLDGVQAASAAEPASTGQPAAETASAAPERSMSSLALARAARAAGDWVAAGRHYQSAVQRDPSDLEALTGLGDSARAQGNSAAAKSHYGAVLRLQSSYAPAQRGYADIAWADGQKDEAVRLYRRLIQHGAATAVIKQRVAEFEGASAEPAASGSASAAPAEEAEPQGAPDPAEPSEAATAEQPQPEPAASSQATPPAAAAPPGPPSRDAVEPAAPPAIEPELL